MNFINDEHIKVGELEIVNHLPKIGIDSVRKEIIEGLISEQKYISPKYFYDQTGSELFEEITKLEEYYPTRCEKEILSTLIGKLDIDLYDLDIIEIGSGDSSKIISLIKQIESQILSSINYFPVDISQSAIEKSMEDISANFKLNDIRGIVADFLHSFDYVPRRNKRLFCFLGSTIGNLSTSEVKMFMTKLGDVMEKGDSLLLGTDIIKNNSIIELAYNDGKGVTAEFNKNILKVVNGHIDSNFNTNDFEHWAFYKKELHRIEMHLKAKRNIQITIGSINKEIQIKEGETIHTESSHKFSTNHLEAMGQYGGLTIKNLFTDSKKWFNLVHYIK